MKTVASVRYLVILGSVLPVLLSLPCVAQEQLKAVDFVAACKAYRARNTASEETADDKNINGAICRAYLQGFLAGTNQVVNEEDLPSPFMQRALRTKAHGGRERVEALTVGPYCLPAGESLDSIIEKLADDENAYGDNSGADYAIRQVLRRHYRCDG